MSRNCVEEKHQSTWRACFDYSGATGSWQKNPAATLQDSGCGTAIEGAKRLARAGGVPLYQAYSVAEHSRALNNSSRKRYGTARATLAKLNEKRFNPGTTQNTTNLKTKFITFIKTHQQTGRGAEMCASSDRQPSKSCTHRRLQRAPPLSVSLSLSLSLPPSL